MSRRPVFLWLLWVSLLCCGMAVAQTPRLHWLGTFGGGYSLGRSISADGTTVVGWFGGSYASDQRAALWKVGERPVAIPHLGGGESQAYDISADGNIVVGYSRDSRGNWRAFRWTPATGTQPLDTANRDSSAHGVNANGSVIVGEMRAFQIGSPSRAFRWTAETGMQDIHTLTDPRQSFATDVSADGRVIVGACITPTNRYRAFRWTAETGMQLIHPVGSDESIARGIAADGNTIVGYYIDARGDYRACYWGANGLLQEVPVPSDYRYSVAWGASADGSVIVGEVRTTISTERRAFRWNRSSGVFELIGDFGGGQSVAYGVSDDGQTICGAATAPDRSRLAFRWRAETGLVNLGSLSANSSVAYDVSADGRVVVGICSNTAGGERAFMWTLDAGLHPLAATPANIRHGAYGISADGSAIVGYSEWRNSYNTLQIGPTLWTNSSSYLLTGIDSEGEALKISANGEVVIGWLRGTRGYNRPFRWKASEGAINLAPPQWDSQNINIRAHVVDARGESVAGIITIITTQMFRWTVQSGFEVIPSPAEYPNAYPRGISADGRLVVGFMSNSTTREQRAFLWSVSTGYRNLGTVNNLLSDAYAISADGSIVVGYTGDRWNGNSRAFIWTESGGMQDLSNRYATLLSEGSHLGVATAISPDGRYIVGYGFNADNQRFEAFLLDTGCPIRGDVDRNGVVDDADLLMLLFDFGEDGYRNADINWDGVIDDADLLELLLNFGSGC